MNKDKIPRVYDLSARREKEFKMRERAMRESGRGGGREEHESFQPTMLTFKAFLQTQDDSITDEESLEKYGEYKLEFQRQQLNEFFVSHKGEEWFRSRYQPAAKEARQALVKERLDRRLEAFSHLLREGGTFCELALEEDQAEDLTNLLDSTVAFLEEKESMEECRTTSVFLASLHPSITRAELEAVVGALPGYVRLALAEPEPARMFQRKCWVSFQRGAKIREICFSLNSMKVREHELKAVVNKDLSRRIRAADWSHTHPRVVQASIDCCKQVISLLDRLGGLYLAEGAPNPVLEDVHLEPMRVLDRLLLYLRMVHSIDWYSQGASLVQHSIEDWMPNRLGLLHVRPQGEPKTLEEEEVEKTVARLQDNTQSFIKDKQPSESEAAAKLGLKVDTDEVEKFMSASMQELEKDKWMCTLSQKKFKAPEYVRKHIINKFQDRIDEVKSDVEFFNNYIKDSKRPSMPPAPPMAPRLPETEGRAMKRLSEPLNISREFGDQPPAKRSIKERLGHGGVRVTHSVKDPRAIVDYSDVDSFAVVDFDF